MTKEELARAKELPGICSNPYSIVKETDVSIVKEYISLLNKSILEIARLQKMNEVMKGTLIKIKVGYEFATHPNGGALAKPIRVDELVGEALQKVKELEDLK